MLDFSNNSIKIQIPPKPHLVIKTLEKSGFDAYIVGGCVRDYLMGKIPNDWDITTNAHTTDVQRLFPKSFETGIKHGTITVIIDKEPIEVTTYRIDGEYEDHRRPKQVLFTTKLEDDLSRRDFTINAMAYSPNAGLVDLYNGIKDLKAHLIKTVGSPDLRFKEDALRIMRCVRFSICLGFYIEQNTLESLKRNIVLLNDIAVERIREEFNKILICGKDLILLYKTEILKYTIPQLNLIFDEIRNNKTGGQHIVDVTNLVRNDLALRWAALLHELDYKQVAEILNRFKFDNRSKKIILKLVKNIFVFIEPTGQSIKKLINKIGVYEFYLLLELKKADVLSNPTQAKQSLEDLNIISEIYDEVKNDPMKIEDLEINGKDLISLGIEGKEIGLILKKLVNFILINPKENEKIKLIEKAKEFKEKL